MVAPFRSCFFWCSAYLAIPKSDEKVGSGTCPRLHLGNMNHNFCRFCMAVAYYSIGFSVMASATFMSNGVVILMFSLLPSTSVISCPRYSTTEASSVKVSI